MNRLMMIVLLSLIPGAASAAPEGKWICSYAEPGFQSQVVVQFVGGKLITGNAKSRRVVENAAISDDYVFWADGTQNEFYPKEGRLVSANATQTLTFACSRQ
jgi:hypothetical protein